MSRFLHRMTWLPVLVGLASLLLIAAGDKLPGIAPPLKECIAPPPRTGPLPGPATPPADFIVTVNGDLQWVVNGEVNPVLTLNRGQSYTFDLTAFGDAHPFVINSNATNPFGTLYSGPASGTTITFTPGNSLPSTVYYHCSVHYGSMAGTIVLPGGAACAGDFNTDQAVNSTDLGLFVGAFGHPCTGCAEDMNHDQVVNSTDFGLFVSVFGSVCDRQALH